MMMEDTYVFIDGAYLSKISKCLGGGEYISFDINQFAITIAKSQGLWCKGVFYYTAPPFQSSTPTEEEADRKAKHDKFVNQLKRIPNFVIREGRCQKIQDDYNQKGVDTLLTMDLFDVCKSKKDIKVIIVVICDTDFVPILNKLRETGVQIILFYYSDFVRGSKFSLSNYLHTACDKRILIEKEHLLKSVWPNKNND